ncbi:UDP-N-acetylglucosamine--undecaprenyl-phosphate N-acetylglucosaminephosphotransferase [Pseudoalteromonas sp. McH1-7]|uniref:UDP-N-acetylglucosamine--undecaprenyl-phosphate N-acetylglucosaminephosphotransferase n=1 Tax=Pseudoalteromonas TaxID=53246 RepID=UPI00158FE58D|nr:UDP-N-acetylglucosamine--undecaprenyl-phosphate N-acetylglucosaminephosphotransferase [Pseudoalteromonas peptidolytica]MDW7549415.1 UDP-N-acetylglucosamine--undecaprenyl-phosphate N-acetylglucosaminephosphotransferase [Pseudoalteromonas peptidolytica]NUZ10684.1 UDP-N-acetylglucosamine--undecaprenyl-phosphate N-acetylglucosaminephosphotransferase [Pseudoalteromonas sp. McH1-7]
MVLSNIIIFFAAFLSLFIFRKLAKIINLVDTPNERKNHKGRIPLVGGVAIFVIVCCYLWLSGNGMTNVGVYLICAVSLLVIGVIDDLIDVSFKLRLVVQAGVAFAMIFFADLMLSQVGTLVGPFELNIGMFGIVATVIAVVGAINAFNMVDGIDGLLGGLATVSFSSMAVLFYLAGLTELFAFTIAIVVATLPYILMNLGIPLGRRFKVFMGDAGSTVIGFTVVWLLLEGSQGSVVAIDPVTALWIAAIPIMDAVSTIMRRIKKGQSPFKPDREHLHHILQRLGVGPKMTLLVICSIASLFALVGIFGQLYNVPDYVMFYGFIFCQLVYNQIMVNIWKITVLVRKFFGISKKQEANESEERVG